ncbi:MAG: PEP-CTERM sorting domain-containing protein [Pseudomonadota bacterium]
MKHNLKTLVYTCALLGFSQLATATPILASGAINDANFNVAQNIQDTDHSGGLSVGDLIYGILNVTRISSAGNTLWNANNVPGPGVDSLSGYYIAAVTSITALPTPFAASITLGPAGVDPNGVMSASDLAAHTAVKLFTDTTTPFQTGVSIASDIANATNGSLWLALGLNGGYWSSVLMNNGLIFAGGGLNLTNNNTGETFTPQSNPSCSPGCPPTDFVFNTIANDNGPGQVWQYSGANNGSLATVPEPATPLLIIAGLLGWAASRRDRHKDVSPLST